MKRLLCILSVLLLLTGCTGKPQETDIPETTASAEPTIPWIDQVGTAWDREGALRELPLTVTDGLHYTSARAFDGDLLLWSIDNHLTDVYSLELCLIDLDSGSVKADVEIDFGEYVNPQILGEELILCDSASDRLLVLDNDLKIKKEWKIPDYEGNFIMGADEILYIDDWNGDLIRFDLKTGGSEPLLPDVHVEYFSLRGEQISVEYLDPETGAVRHMLMDLHTGEFLQPSLESVYSDLYYADGTWLCESYRDRYIVYVSGGGDDFLRAEMGYDMLKLVDGDTLLLTSQEGGVLSLHDLTGKALARAVMTEASFSYNCMDLIRSEAFGGYFLILSDNSGSLRLLYWDTSKGQTGEDICFEPVPQPGEAEMAVRRRAEELGSRYGLNILVGTQCGTDFYDFTAEQVTDWDTVSLALDILENALEVYPEGFFRQLHYEDVRRTEIHLVGTLTATTEEYTDTYEAFVQDNFDSHVMVADINLADERTYYHEFSHIIDSYLEWDAMNREDALFSDAAWCSLNPGWFPGYTYDYSMEQYVEDYTCFIDSYSTINPTEDRARVLEYAMADFGYLNFEDAEVLLRKLDYYCRCIRDAFDTSGWPEEVLWEQYLK